MHAETKAVNSSLTLTHLQPHTHDRKWKISILTETNLRNVSRGEGDSAETMNGKLSHGVSIVSSLVIC